MNERDNCWCCGRLHDKRTEDPWEGRMDGYCDDCSQARCDAYPGHCPVPVSDRWPLAEATAREEKT